MSLGNEKYSADSGQKRVSIHSRVLRIVLTTTLLVLMAASITAIVCIGWIRSSTEKALTEQVENGLMGAVEQKADLAESKLDHYAKYIKFSAFYLEDMYKNRKAMIRSGHMYYSPVDTKEYALTRGFSSSELTAEDLRDELLFFSNIEKIWAPISLENTELISTIYAGTASGLLTSYDRWSYISVPPEGEELVYDFLKADWYTQGIKEKDSFYTGLYIDSQGRGLTITVASPFRDADGKVAGVCAADLDITELYNDMLALDLGKGTFSFTLDRDGKLISPEAGNATAESYTGLTTAEIRDLIETPNSFIRKEDRIYVSVPVDRVGWTLCACVPTRLIEDSIEDANTSIRYATGIFMMIAILLLFISVIAVNRAARSITHPMELLGNDMKTIADGDLKHRAKVYSNDEIGDMTVELNSLVDKLSATMDNLVQAKQRADDMSELATRDSLTGIRNKTAYEALASDIDQKLANGPVPFGIVMIDMNNLKEINDSYGHNHGDIAIQKVSDAICGTFAHSPVFRVGGDEFVVILMNSDYYNIVDLENEFKRIVEETSKDQTLQPWEKIAAAIGYAIYDESMDKNVQNVMERADKEMYRCKHTMKLWDN